MELVDPSLGSNYSKPEAMTMLNVALLCTNPSPTLRPPMSSVVSMLQGKIPVQPPLVHKSSLDKGARFKAFERLIQDSQTDDSSYSHDTHDQIGISMDGTSKGFSDSFKGKDDKQESSPSSKVLKDLSDKNSE